VGGGGDKGLALTVVRCEIQKPGAGGLTAEKGFPLPPTAKLT